MKCQTCGCECSDNAKFCRNCGSALEANAPDATIGTTAPQAGGPMAEQPAANQTTQFMTSLFTFYIKGEVTVAPDHLHIKIPNTLLGLIPFGSNERNFDVCHISSTEMNSSLSLGLLFAGIITAIFGFSLLGEKDGFACGLVVILLGVLWAINAFKTQIVFRFDSGEIYSISLIVFEKDKAATICDGVNGMLAARTYDTNYRTHSMASADRIISAINAR